MGAGATRPQESNEPVDQDVNKLEPPWQVAEDTCFHVYPLEGGPVDCKKNHTVVLEVGALGFRLLRHRLMVPLLMFPWGQIHSWSHASRHFSFRYFDDSKRAIQQISLSLRDVEPLLSCIQKVVEAILEDRKVNAISTEDYESILTALRQAAARQEAPLQVIAQRAQERYFMADQGQALMALMPSTFDKIELAVMLHSRLVDQSRFAVMLEQLEDPGDRDNVWLRITSAKAKGPGQSGGGARSASMLRTSVSLGAAGAGSPSGSGPASPTAGRTPSGLLSSGSVGGLGPASPNARSASNLKATASVTGAGAAAAGVVTGPASPASATNASA